MDPSDHIDPKFFGNGQICKHICFISLKIWSHRLTVRTPGSHPGNPGSIPGEITKLRTSHHVAFLIW